MHYKNGREAKNGDKVVLLGGKYTNPDTGKVSRYGVSVVGILYDAQAGNDHCNGKLAPICANDPCPDLKECLHLDDVREALDDLAAVPDTSKVG